jgi:hypothetical protein
MSPSPQNVRCSHTTAAGRPCRAWAVHGTDPPACAAHAGRIRGAGAPQGNQNARTHGFYATVFSADELADLLRYATNLSLDGEIACARFALRRVLNYLKAHTEDLPDDPATGSAPRTERGELTATDYTRLVSLSLQAVRTIARLVRDQQMAPVKNTGPFPHEIVKLLDEAERKHQE